MSPEKKLATLNLELPPPPAPGGIYLPFTRHRRLLFLSGVISARNGEVITGSVGAERSVQDGYAAARECGLLLLAVVRTALGSLDRVEQIISLNGYVNSVPGFAESPAVVNGASELLVEIFGEAGKHARAAIGVSGLPKNALVEIQMTVGVKSND